jgi:aspartyl-tRNA(Asn)/glutamyl-tRNA(Gln) amidotransferase subunit A
VSRYGAMALAYSLDKIGPMGRTAEDCALVLAAIAGHDARDRSSLPPGEASFTYPAPVPASLRIGWLTNAWEKTDPEIVAAVNAAVHVLEQNGAKFQDTKLPEGPYEAAAGTIISVEGVAAFQKLLDSGKVAELTDPLGQIAAYVNEQIAASDYLRALQIRGICQKKSDAMFDEFDVIAGPSLPVAATPLETNLETDLSFADPLGGIGNLCGLPAISVPCGFTSKKLPVGIQFLARVRNDRAVVAAAKLFQQHTDWHTKRPPLASSN